MKFPTLVELKGPRLVTGVGFNGGGGGKKPATVQVFELDFSQLTPNNGNVVTHAISSSTDSPLNLVMWWLINFQLWD